MGDSNLYLNFLKDLRSLEYNYQSYIEKESLSIIEKQNGSFPPFGSSFEDFKGLHLKLALLFQ
jgi:hypothetical protein